MQSRPQDGLPKIQIQICKIIPRLLPLPNIQPRPFISIHIRHDCGFEFFNTIIPLSPPILKILTEHVTHSTTHYKLYKFVHCLYPLLLSFILLQPQNCNVLHKNCVTYNTCDHTQAPNKHIRTMELIVLIADTSTNYKIWSINCCL